MDSPERDLELALLRLAWRVDALDKWRERIDAFCADTTMALDGLTKADEIAEAVANKMSEAGRIKFTKVQLGVAILGLGAAYAAPFVAWVAHSHA